MATFTRAARSQECSHCFGDSSLTTDYLTKVIGRNVEFERKDIAIITNFTNLYGLRFVYQGFCDVLNKSTHFFPLMIMNFHFLNYIAEHPPRPINRRWARSIGPYFIRLE